MNYENTVQETSSGAADPVSRKTEILSVKIVQVQLRFNKECDRQIDRHAMKEGK